MTSCDGLPVRTANTAMTPAAANLMTITLVGTEKLTVDCTRPGWHDRRTIDARASYRRVAREWAVRDVVIVGAVRTPVGRRKGGLAGLHPVDLSAHVLGTLAQRTGFEPSDVDDVILGCVSQVGEQSW